MVQSIYLEILNFRTYKYQQCTLLTLLAVYTVLPRPRLFVTPPSQMPGGGIDKKGGGGGLL